MVAVEAYGQGVDGKVAAVLVVLQGAIFYMWFAAVVAVALLTGTHKLDLHAMVFDLGGAEVAEHRYVGLAPQGLLEGLGHLYAAAHHDHVDIVRQPLKKQVSYITAYHIARHAQLIGHAPYGSEYVLVEQFGQLCVTQISHYLSLFYLQS